MDQMKLLPILALGAALCCVALQAWWVYVADDDSCAEAVTFARVHGVPATQAA